MTVDLAGLREQVGQGPSDTVLMAALTAAIEAVEDRYGPSAPTLREHLRPFGQWVKLGRRAEAVQAVLEGTTEVDAADYEIWSGGRYLRRLSSDSPTAWTDMVDVTYSPLSEEAGRDRIVVALCKLDIAHQPGLASISVGPWSESYTGQGPEEYAATRDAILDSLRAPLVGVW